MDLAQPAAGKKKGEAHPTREWGRYWHQGWASPDFSLAADRESEQEDSETNWQRFIRSSSWVGLAHQNSEAVTQHSSRLTAQRSTVGGAVKRFQRTRRLRREAGSAPLMPTRPESRHVADPHPRCVACCPAPKPLPSRVLRISSKLPPRCRVAFRQHCQAVRPFVGAAGLYEFPISQPSIPIAFTSNRPRCALRILIKL